MIYLYVKTHNVTGLKYFGKTTRESCIYTYCGSGKYWKRHLRIYGKDISTEIIGCFEDEEECKKAALEFSRVNEIVKSKEWANLIEENGINGGPVGNMYWSNRKHSEESRRKMSIAAMGNTKMLGKKASQETIQKRVAKTTGRKRTEESRRKMSASAKARWANREILI